jgi:hypothetical protein
MEEARPKTISIFLTDGNPNSIKMLEVSNRNIRGYVIPRQRVPYIKNYPELRQPCLYLLFNQDKTKAYIGECENFYERIRQHDGKDFWDIAVAFIDTKNGLDKGSIKYLEHLAVETSRAARQMETDNKTVPPKNTLHIFKEPEVKEFFDILVLLTATMGYPLFDIVKTDKIDENNLWYCRGRKTDAKGIYSDAGFKVLAGSTIDAEITPHFSILYPNETAARAKRLNESAQLLDNGTYIVSEDITFRSVSAASGFCLGRSANGWIDWKNSSGKTMDEVLRQKQ